ncbi:MAG: hypothetical protein JNL32_08480 [Candidatus Kapabacteria bacterium]|nr:hypothetical protein [Candidatus Kapabacteria bacterium]
MQTSTRIYTYFTTRIALLSGVLMLVMAGVACSPNAMMPATNAVTIATFNMEWLGDGSSDDVKPRTEEDYKNMADVIRMLRADIIGVEEVESEAAMKRVMKYLDGYSVSIGSSARQQNVGVIYRNTVSVSEPREYMPVAVRPDRNRPGYTVRCKKGNLDWMMMVVHFKSTSRADSTPELRADAIQNRKQQSEVASKWADSVAASGERDVLIIGDLNDYPKREQNPTLTALIQNNNLTFLTADLKSCMRDNWSSIDHIIATKQMAARMIPASMNHFSFSAMFSKETAKNISDHCPVFIQFSISEPDND